MDLKMQIEEVKGVGPKLGRLFNKLAIYTVYDLIQYYPKNYLDYSKITDIKNIKPGPVNLRVRFKSVKQSYSYRKTSITNAVAIDDTGLVKITWFNQPYRQKTIQTDEWYFLSGKFELKYRQFQIINPIIEQVSSDPLSTGGIVPIYGLTEGLKSYKIRRIVKSVLEISQFPEILPKLILEQQQLTSLKNAYYQIHFPSSQKALDLARERLAHDELLKVVLASQMNKAESSNLKSYNIQFRLADVQHFIQKLPFKLTDQQRLVSWQIIQDIQSNNPMNRLIEGDVGTGKTVIAALVALMVVKNDYQVAVMAPTEILAQQHYKTLLNFFKEVDPGLKIDILTGSTLAKDRQRILNQLANNNLKIVVGTHSLISLEVKFKKLALVVIDEQHRFGVKQRNILKKTNRAMPHLLSLSATPIPRTLALTFFGELSISRLTEKPFKETIIKTEILAKTQYERSREPIIKRLLEGQQLYVVCPAINEDSNLNSVKLIHQRTKELYPNFKVGMLHGKMKSKDKEKVLELFINHKINILVSTTVIEVGVDIANATMIIIYDAENFGLAQLYQLRGRVGRHQKDGLCYLIHNDDQIASNRLKQFLSAKNGMELAELDFKLRGPGTILGLAQHGRSDLRLVDFSDRHFINMVRESSNLFLSNPKNMLQYKQLLHEVNRYRQIIKLD
jgi:ATP-dependent DNA helicase RecG